MKPIKFLLTVFILSVDCVANAQTLVINDFESYDNTDALRSEWFVFGAAIADRPYIDSNANDGTKAALLPVNWSGSNNDANLNYFSNLGAAGDLSAYTAVNVFVNLQTAGDPPSNSTSVLLAIQGGAGNSIFQTDSEFAQIATVGSYSELSFSLSEPEMVLTEDNSDSFADVLSNISSIRLRFENTSTSGAQNILVDSLTAVPEPSSIALLLGLGSLSFVLYRRKLKNNYEK